MRKIRVCYVNEILEMPSGMYSRSEGPEVEERVMKIHPDDDHDLFTQKGALEFSFFSVKREFPELSPNVACENDLQEAGEDGYPLADAIYTRMEEYRTANFELAELVETPFLPEVNGWRTLYFPPVVMVEKVMVEKMIETLIVTRHAGLMFWLAKKGITGTVIAQASPDDVRGKKVYGVLPLYLAAEAAEVWTVDMPNLPAEKRGVDLSPEEMETFGAVLVGYRVIKL